MVRRRDRIIAMTIAIAFFATSFALSFFVIWEIVRNNKEAKKVDQTDTSGLNENPQQSSTPLQGTQLANFTPVENVDKLQRIEITPGTGAEVKPGAKVTIDYTGANAATGVIFESSLDKGEPISESLGIFIKGWTDGIPGAKVGGTYRLLIPFAQAYQGIPDRPQGDLVFDITIHAAE